jgi:hypothetical protein
MHTVRHQVRYDNVLFDLHSCICALLLYAVLLLRGCNGSVYYMQPQ